MPVTINIYYTGEGNAAKNFVREMVGSGTVDAIRHEPGNLRYDYFLSMEDPRTVLLIDEWKDQAAIDAHHDSPMMKTIASLRDKYDLHMKVYRYLSDDAGEPAADQAFIRK